MASSSTDDDRYKILATNIDAFFLVSNAIAIYFMQCGFAILECGAVRSKNGTNILIKNMLDSFIGAICYWIMGYALAFGGGNAFCGDHFWALAGLPAADLSQVFFHYTFAVTSSTIVSGAVAERCNFSAYMVYSVIFTAFMYPVASHWAWAPEGWLSTGFTITRDNSTFTATYRDFAGSGVVHVVGGTAAFFGAFLLGPRIGRFDTDDDKAEGLYGHSVPMAALGGFILFLGFFSFNSSSQGHISEPGDAEAIASAVFNTILAGSFGAVVTVVIQLFINYYQHRHWRWSLLSTINGGLAGMVSICAGCDVVAPWGAAVIGAIAGVVYHLASFAVCAMKVDDPIDAVAVHFGGGVWGVIAVALFNNVDGVFLHRNIQSGYVLGVNLLGVVAICAWAALVSTVVFGILKLLKILRVSRELELGGLDIPEHGEPAYPVSAYKDNQLVHHLSKLFDDVIDSSRTGNHDNNQIEQAVTAFRRASMVLINGAISGRSIPRLLEKKSVPGNIPLEIIEDEEEEEEEEDEEERKEREMENERERGKNEGKDYIVLGRSPHYSTPAKDETVLDTYM